MDTVPRGLRRKEGQGLVEYVLIIVLVSVALVGGLAAFGGGLGSVYNNITVGLANALG